MAGREGEGMMGVIETSFVTRSSNKTYGARRHLSDNLRERAESVKNVVRSFESLRDLPKPFLQPLRSRESLRDLRTSCDSIRSMTAGLLSLDDSSPDCGDSVWSAPGNIERSSTLQVILLVQPNA